MKQALISTQTMPQAVLLPGQLAAPMLVIEDLSAPDIIPDADALIFTSRYAPGIDWVHNLRDLPCWCVGETTAHAADAAGFTIAGVGEGGVQNLVPILPGDHRYLLPGAVKIHPATKPALIGHDVRFLPAYKAQAVTKLSDDVITALKNDAASHVAFFSTRGVQIWHQLVEQAGLRRTLVRMTALCLSTDMLSSVYKEYWQDVQAAEKPSMASLSQIIK